MRGSCRDTFHIILKIMRTMLPAYGHFVLLRIFPNRSSMKLGGYNNLKKNEKTDLVENSFH